MGAFLSFLLHTSLLGRLPAVGLAACPAIFLTPKHCLYRRGVRCLLGAMLSVPKCVSSHPTAACLLISSPRCIPCLAGARAGGGAQHCSRWTGPTDSGFCLPALAHWLCSPQASALFYLGVCLGSAAPRAASRTAMAYGITHLAYPAAQIQPGSMRGTSGSFSVLPLTASTPKSHGTLGHAVPFRRLCYSMNDLLSRTRPLTTCPSCLHLFPVRGAVVNCFHDLQPTNLGL